MNIKLVICDIDNTLVQKRKPLTKKAYEAVLKLKEHGVYFGLASGRGINQLLTLAEDWNIPCDIAIGMNGSEIYDGLTGQTQRYYGLEAKWLEEIFKIMEPFNTMPHLVQNGVTFIENNDAAIKESSQYVKNTNPPHVVESRSEFWQNPATKVGFRVSADDMPMIEEHVSKFPSTDYVGFKTENTMFEFCSIHASKGDLLERFCKAHDIDLKDVWAFGDMTNDISMLEVAGVGVCMKNGSDDAKAASDIITEKSCDEDGWAEFVFDHILIPNKWN